MTGPRVDADVLFQVREALAGLERYAGTERPDRRVQAALAALRAAETRLANPLVAVRAGAAEEAVEGLREAVGLPPRGSQAP